jgi:hypothetical protein
MAQRRSFCSYCRSLTVVGAPQVNRAESGLSLAQFGLGSSPAAAEPGSSPNSPGQGRLSPGPGGACGFSVEPEASPSRLRVSAYGLPLVSARCRTTPAPPPLPPARLPTGRLPTGRAPPRLAVNPIVHSSAAAVSLHLGPVAASAAPHLTRRCEALPRRKGASRRRTRGMQPSRLSTAATASTLYGGVCVG